MFPLLKKPLITAGNLYCYFIKKLIFLFCTLVLLGCSSDKTNDSLLSDILSKNNNEELISSLSTHNDSISFGWNLKYDLFSGKVYTINVNIYNSKQFDSIESKRKLKVESELIQTTLETELNSYSSLKKMNLYLISNGKPVDSLKIEINKAF